MAIEFPAGFVWGTATAAHQVEGANVNSDYWAMEEAHGPAFAEPSDDAVDHYHLFRDDISLLKDLGFNSYRFSIEWARIEPEPGKFSKEEIAHYREMLLFCRELDILPCVTLHHFTSPGWVAADGGWENPATADRFATYARVVAEELGEHFGLVCTVNEPNACAWLQKLYILCQVSEFRSAGWFARAAQACGSTPDRFAPYLFCDGFKAIPVFIDGHRKSTEALKKAGVTCPVGMTLAIQCEETEPGGEQHLAETRRLCHDPFLEACRGDDFVGLQTYTRCVYTPNGLRVPRTAGVELTQVGYEYYPQGIAAALRRIVDATGCPVHVTEHGVASTEDSRRVDFYRTALTTLHECLQEGIDVRGYYAWSLLDNFEWIHGYTPQFGLVAVDRRTQVRTPKPSAYWLGGVARSGLVPPPDAEPARARRHATQRS